MQGARSAPPSSAAPAKDDAGGDIALILLKPLYFLGVFLDSLTYAFLPKFMQEAATASGMPESFASVPFTAYYLLFALSLIPAGNLTERYGPNRVIVAGLILAGIGQLIMLYGLGVVVSTGVVSRLVDRNRNTQAILFWGAIMSGLGLMLVELMGQIRR